MRRINLRLLCWSLLLMASASLSASDIDEVLQQVSQNNTLLASLRQQAAADKLGNKTGIYLENPEVSYHYLWGNSEAPGNRVDFEASQSFDFPTAYYHKRKVAVMQNEQVDMEYLIQEKTILLEAYQVCVNLTYQNALLAELTLRTTHARQILDANQQRFDRGDLGVLELNKSKLNALLAEKEYNEAATEQTFLCDELTRLNGGQAVVFAADRFEPIAALFEFDEWFDEAQSYNLELHSLSKEAELTRQSEKLQKAMNLPKFSAGYMSETVVNERFQGVAVGLSIPLFENKNTVRQLKAQSLAVQASHKDAEQSYYNTMKALYNKAVNLWTIEKQYRQNGLSDDAANLLKQAFDAGELSLIEYTEQISDYYEIVTVLLETSRDLRLTLGEMNRWRF